MSTPIRVVSEFTHRFIGSHGRPVTVYEITSRTLHGRFLLKPTRRHKQLILGVLGRCKAQLGFELYGYGFMSNHYSILVGVETAHQLSKIMCYLNSNVARELGRKEHSDWREKFWGRRGRPIVILTEADLIARMRYLLANSTKEHLVSHPTVWPGAHCAKALCEGTIDRGLWIDRTAMCNSGYTLTEAEATTVYSVVLEKLPCLKDLDDAAYRARIKEMCDEIAEEADAVRKEAGVRLGGIKRILSVNSHDSPTHFEKTPAPLAHCSDTEVFLRFKEQYRAFIAAYRAAYRELRRQVLCESSPFPRGCIAPTTSYLVPDD